MSEKTRPKLHMKKTIIITAIILNLLLGYVTWNSMLDGQRVTLFEWFFLMIIANISVVIPICLLISLICKIKEYIKNQIKRDRESDQISLYDPRDPFTGSK